MQDAWRQSTIENVRNSILSINLVVALLQRDVPLSSDILDINYSVETVAEFLRLSGEVSSYMSAASSTTSVCLRETGDRLSSNIAEAGRVEESLREDSSQESVNTIRVQTLEDNIREIQRNISQREDELNDAQRALATAQRKQEEQENTMKLVHIGAMATMLFVPLLGFAIGAVNMIANSNAIDDQQDVINGIERQLGELRSGLQSQRDNLANEKGELERLRSRISGLRQRIRSLNTELARLRTSNAALAELSQRINDCLYTVNRALGSSENIATMSSMRNVVTGIRGVVDALGAHSMFEGPLSQLEHAPFAALDRRVGAIRHARISA